MTISHTVYGIAVSLAIFAAFVTGFCIGAWYERKAWQKFVRDGVDADPPDVDERT